VTLPDWTDPLYEAGEMRAVDAWAIEEQGVPQADLMERAALGLARMTAAVAGEGPIRIVAGKGNNGGDGLVAARRLAEAGSRVVVALVATVSRPTTPNAAKNWDRILRNERIVVVQTSTPHDIALLGRDIDKAAVVVDALLGTGVRGTLREPIRSAVEAIRRARAAAVPVVAVDTPTAVDLTSGDPSDPVVRADLTITFHRPKTGLLTRRGSALAGRVLVAPIGIPLEADRV